MTLSKLCVAAGYFMPPESEGENPVITALTADSREAMPGCLFFAIRGARCDRNEHIAEAVRRGAVAVVTDKSVTGTDAVILTVGSVREAYARFWSAWYGNPGRLLRLIGVTGTNGKTSVSTILCRILEHAMIPCGLIGTVENRCLGTPLPKMKASGGELANMTTPDPPELYALLREMADRGAMTVVMEVSSHALELEKVAPLHFSAAIFTNLTPEHIDFHGDMMRYAQAKAKLFHRADLSVINLDAAGGAKMAEEVRGRLVTCADAGSAADYTATEHGSLMEVGTRYTLQGKNLSVEITCRIPGRFTVSNTMEAAVCARELGISTTLIRDALASMDGICGRMERVKLPPACNFSVWIDYAHTPDALENLLRTVRDLRRPGQRIVLLFGCGGDRDKTKRPRMGGIAARYADDVIVTSDNNRTESREEIIIQIVRGFDRADGLRVIPDRAEAIQNAIQNARSGDIILLAGKGHETYEIDGEERRVFDERKIVQEAAAALLEKQTFSHSVPADTQKEQQTIPNGDAQSRKEGER